MSKKDTIRSGLGKFNKHGRTLRVQLLGGLALILPVLVVSVGLIGHWSVRRDMADAKVNHLRLLGNFASSLLAPTMAIADDEIASLRAAVKQLVWSPYIEAVAVVDRSVHQIAGNAWTSDPVDSEPSVDALRQSMRTERQVVRINTAVRGRAEVVTPIYAAGSDELIGAVGLRVPWSVEVDERPQMMFWVLVALDCVVVLLFVGVVLTRYVVHPLETLRRAASDVAQGNLDTAIVPGGAFELASLGHSFLEMTTALKDQLRRLESQRQSLIQSEKLASVGRLAAGVAHEVGNPLQAIIGFTDVMIDTDVTDDTRADYLRRIQKESDRIHQIIRELLDYARPVDDKSERIDLATTVKQALSLVQHQKSFAKIEIDVDLPKADAPDAITVVANQSRIVQVMLNLLMNAADAMAGEGRIQITADVDDSSVRLFVSNDGPPIGESDRERIFDPFFTTKDPGKGTGLGLAVARSIVQSFGGELTHADTAETCFTLALPR